MEQVDTVVDYLTGEPVPDVGPEANRQAVMRFLVEEKGFSKDDMERDVPIAVDVAGEPYRSRLDLVVGVDGKRFMAVKCVAASIGSWEREIVAAARLLDAYQIPVAVVSDGEDAVVIDTVSGKRTGKDMNAIPDRDAASSRMAETEPVPLPEERLHRERLIFRSYDTMNVNRL